MGTCNLAMEKSIFLLCLILMSASAKNKKYLVELEDKGSKASEHGSEYSDDDENNKNAASEDEEPKDGEPSKDGDPSEDREPKGEFTSLIEDVPADKQMDEPEQLDPANTKSGCTMPPQQDMDRHMDEGNCWDHNRCKFTEPGLMPATSDQDKCIQRFCVKDKGTGEVDWGCTHCAIIQKDGSAHGIAGEYWRSCNYTHRPCDFCSCKTTEGKKAELLVEEDGCKKPKRCAKVCPSHQESRVGDKFNCWLDDYNCPAKCECKEENGRAFISAKYYGECGPKIGDKCNLI